MVHIASLCSSLGETFFKLIQQSLRPKFLKSCLIDNPRNITTTYMTTGSPKIKDWEVLCLQSPSFVEPRPRWLREDKRALGTRMMT